MRMKDFRKIHLKTGGSTTISTNITTQEINAVNQNGESVMIPRTYKVLVD